MLKNNYWKKLYFGLVLKYITIFIFIYLILTGKSIWIVFFLICSYLLLELYSNREISRNMPMLDDPLNIGNTATVLEDFQPVGNFFEGAIQLNGVKWKAKSNTSPLKKGSVVITTSLNNLTYEVEEKT